MLAVWLFDAVGWNVSLDWPRRHRRWFWIVQAFFAFMLFNATAVFGPWYWRPTAVGFVGILWIAHQAANHG